MFLSTPKFTLKKLAQNRLILKNSQIANIGVPKIGAKNLNLIEIMELFVVNWKE